MSRLPESCTFWMDETTQCGRQPVVVDYLEGDHVRGDRLVSSNCSLHDGAAARRYALAKGYDRRDRKPELTVVA